MSEFGDPIGKVDDLIRRYESGERNFPGIQLLGIKILKNINLSGADLSQANLGSVDLTAANLSGANLTGAVLKYARLIQANLANATLTNADLKGANLSGYIMPDGTLDPALERVMNAIGHLKRPACKPIVSEGDSNLRTSKFGGKPWLSAGEQWPSCPNCGNPMRFFFQLNLQELPAELDEKFGKGMLQLFYCTNEVTIDHDSCSTPSVIKIGNVLEGTVRYVEDRTCDIECFGWQPFSSCQLVRIVQADGLPAEFEIPRAGESMSKLHEGEFPPKSIVDWQEVDDYPVWEDIEIRGISIESNDSEFVRDIGMYPQRDKLAGWPGWVQGDECPDCPICHQKMEQLIFELESDDNIPFLWGDVGAGYILQCPEHKEQVAFLWQGS